jgi:hypothetical protein
MPEQWLNADQAQSYANTAKDIEDYMIAGYVKAFGGTAEEWKNKLQEVINLEGKAIVDAGYADRFTDASDYVPARFAASLYPNAPQRLTLPNNPKQTDIMSQTLSKIKSFFGWTGEDETDIAIQAKASADELSALKQKESQIESLTGQVNQLQADLVARDQELASFRANAETEQEVAITALVDDAVTKYKIQASAKDAWIARFKANFEQTKGIFDELPDNAHKPKAPGAPQGTKTKAYGINPKVAEAFGN